MLVVWHHVCLPCKTVKPRLCLMEREWGDTCPPTPRSPRPLRVFKRVGRLLRFSLWFSCASSLLPSEGDNSVLSSTQRQALQDDGATRQKKTGPSPPLTPTWTTERVRNRPPLC